MRREAPLMTQAFTDQATQRANARVNEALNHAQSLQVDVAKAERRAKHLCKACFYGPPRIGGAAMTTQPCMCCGTDQLYGSTNTDVLCVECAKTHELCKHCGGDIEMRKDRKVSLTK